MELYEYAVLSLLLIIPFMLNRRYGGGYHTKRLESCLILSGAILAICFWIAGMASANYLFHVAALLGGVSVSVFSPVDSKKRDLTSADIARYRRKSWERIVLCEGMKQYKITFMVLLTCLILSLAGYANNIETAQQ